MNRSCWIPTLKTIRVCGGALASPTVDMPYRFVCMCNPRLFHPYLKSIFLMILRLAFCSKQILCLTVKKLSWHNFPFGTHVCHYWQQDGRRNYHVQLPSPLTHAVAQLTTGSMQQLDSIRQVLASVQVDGDFQCEPVCQCGLKFCFQCGQDPHSPCTCEM